MKVSIIIIGDEILLGQVTDTNSGHIARAMVAIGAEVVETTVVGDNGDAIRGAVERGLIQSDLVITTGGLGPTRDDITKTVLTDVFGGEFHEDASALENVERVFARRGLIVNELTRRQALVPTSCEVIQNRLGTAPGMIFSRRGRMLISMPGVPFEAVGMLHDSVVSIVVQKFCANSTILHHTLIVSGLSESALAMRLSAFEDSLPEGFHLAYLPVPGYIRLRLDAIGNEKEPTEAKFEQILSQLRSEVDDVLIHDGDATPAEILIERLRATGQTVCSAESCTGGNIAHSITMVAGCSDVYLGSVVSYSNDVKINVLGVPLADIESVGAVSEEVVRSMAEGACRATGATCSMATSGIAGPGGGTPEKPVGTVWMAVHTPKGTVAKCLHLPGDRARVIDRATTEAILMLSREI